MKTYNKLVRDKIPEIIEKKGQLATFRKLDDNEYKIHLEKKLQEEVAEYLSDKNADELADILEVVHALGETLGYSPDELESLREKKTDERGAFKEKLLLVTVG